MRYVSRLLFFDTYTKREMEVLISTWVKISCSYNILLFTGHLSKSSPHCLDKRQTNKTNKTKTFVHLLPDSLSCLCREFQTSAIVITQSHRIFDKIHKISSSLNHVFYSRMLLQPLTDYPEQDPFRWCLLKVLLS